MANIVYTINKKYLELFKASCFSLINNTTVELNINVMTTKNELSREEQDNIVYKLSNLRDDVSIRFVTSSLYEDWKSKNVLYDSFWFSKAVFLRCAIHDSIKEDWVTVLDADTLVLKNIDKLLNYTPQNPIAGTLDLNYYKEMEHSYFCSAIYKTSLNYWRENSLEIKCEELFDKRFDFPEQDIMNEIFKDNITILPPKYCVQTFHKSATMINTLIDPSIIHFAGPIKPDSEKYMFNNDWDMAWKLNYDSVKRLFSN
jgi:lipopolysaccharide biosynthesis glycosyltransferase